MSNTNSKKPHLYFLYVSFFCVSKNRTDLKMVGYMVFPVKDNRDYILTKTKNTWNLTTSTMCKELYEFSKDERLEFYLRIEISGTETKYSDQKHSIHKALKKEDYNLLTEFNPVINDHNETQPLVLNLTYDSSLDIDDPKGNDSMYFLYSPFVFKINGDLIQI